MDLQFRHSDILDYFSSINVSLKLVLHGGSESKKLCCNWAVWSIWINKHDYLCDFYDENK